jgi:hypothetical protein
MAKFKILTSASNKTGDRYNLEAHTSCDDSEAEASSLYRIDKYLTVRKISGESRD